MRSLVLAVAVAVGLAAGLVQAQSGADVAKAKGCLNCHDMDKKKVGPAFKDVAAKNKGKKDAQAAIVAKLKSGKGHPKVAASDDELNAAVGFALGAK